MRNLGKIFSYEEFRKNPDTYILIMASLLVAIASVTGFLSEEKLDAAIVALLGILAFSQLVSRFQVEDVAATWHRERTEIFSKDFPGEYTKAQKNVEKSYFYAGETMGRTMTAMQRHILRILGEKGSVRILLPNPDNSELMKAISKSRSNRTPESIKRSIENSFLLAEECREGDDNIELRTTEVMPHIGINGWDIEERSGKIMVQMYEYKPTEPERAPIFLLETDDRDWFERFHRQIEMLWADGQKYVPKGEVRDSDTAGKKTVPPGA